MTIVLLEGSDLDYLLDRLGVPVDAPTRPYRLRIAIEGGVKVKVNEGTWSPPLGEV